MSDKSCVLLAIGAASLKASEAIDSCVPSTTDADFNTQRDPLTLWDHFVSISKESATTPAVKQMEIPTSDQTLFGLSDTLKNFKLDSSDDYVFIEQPSLQPQNVLAVTTRIVAKSLI